MVNSFVSGVKELDDGVVCLGKGINEGSAAASNNGLISLTFSFCIPFLYCRRGWSPFPGTTESPYRFNIVRKQLYLSTSELSL